MPQKLWGGPVTMGLLEFQLGGPSMFLQQVEEECRQHCAAPARQCKSLGYSDAASTKIRGPAET